MSQTISVIKTKNLHKHFGATKALDGLDLEVTAGEVHGFLGPNGAGKSTTIRVLLGLLRKTGGEVSLLGGEPWKDAVALHKRLAYIPGEVNLWPNLTGGECIDILTKLRGNGIDKKRRQDLLERFELDPSKKFRTYSKGNRQKVAIVAGLASEVELYIMDEPTSGLDPLMESVFQQTVKELRSAGKTILLSSHILAEVEALCDRVSIIRAGKVVESGSLAEMRHLTRTSVKVDTHKPLVGLDKLQGVYDIQKENSHISFEVDTANLSPVMEFITKFGIRHLVCNPPTLEQLFMRYYGDAPPANNPEKSHE
jgi:ABC-2 type transport system ATP-binding protein